MLVCRLGAGKGSSERFGGYTLSSKTRVVREDPPSQA